MGKNISLSERICGSYSTKKTRRCVARLQSLSSPKLLIKAIAALSEKADPSECSIITSEGHLPAKVLPPFQDCDMDTLPDVIRCIFYHYDCDCVPLFENQLGAIQAGKDLANLWWIKKSTSLPDSKTTLASLPATAAVDPSPNNFHYLDEKVLSGTTFQTPKREAVRKNFQTPTLIQKLQTLAVHQESHNQKIF